MSWTVVLENEKEELVASLNKELLHESLFDEDKKKTFRLLRYLDPYGDSIFNKLQMSDLACDINLLVSYGCDKMLCDDILKLLHQCKSSDHLYLKFYGD